MKNTLGKQTVKPVDELELREQSRLAEFGLTLDKENPPSELAISKFCDLADVFAKSLDISPVLIGNGAMLSLSDEGLGATLNRENNRVNILINEKINLLTFSVLWDGLLYRFGLVKSFNDASRKMIEKKISKEESKSMLINKWHSSEKMLVDAVNTVYENIVFDSADQLSEDKKKALKIALYKVLSSEESGSPISDIDTSVLLSSVSKKVFDITGSSLNETDVGILYSLMGIRTDSLSKIQSPSDDQNEVYVPFKFYERIRAMSSDQDFSRINFSTGFALAAYVSRQSGLDISEMLTDVNPDLMPTADELSEMMPGIQEFSEVISSENYSPKNRSSKRAYN